MTKLQRNIIITIIISLITLIGTNISCHAKELEIFSWWTAPGEAEGLNSLFNIYNSLYPTCKIINAAIEGGAGTNSKEVLKTRMLTNNPPDSFQVHGGSELIHTWVKTNYLEPITILCEEENLLEHFPPTLLDLISFQDDIYSIPLNIHRANLLWYNKNIFKKLNLKPPQSIKDFIQIASKLKAEGIIPLALASKNKWPVSHLFESILVSIGGTDFYQDLIDGSIPWTDDRIIYSLEILKKMISFSNNNHYCLTWDQACNLLSEEKAAMTVMGSWAQGYFEADKTKAGIEIAAIPAFTNNIFILVTDTFSLPKDAPNKRNAINWLKMIGSKKAQKYANLYLGSIPARDDIPLEDFKEFSQKQYLDYQNSTIIPSIAHGSAVINTFVDIINDELSIFLYTLNPEETAQRIEDAALTLGIRKNAPF